MMTFEPNFVAGPTTLHAGSIVEPTDACTQGTSSLHWWRTLAQPWALQMRGNTRPIYRAWIVAYKMNCFYFCLATSLYSIFNHFVPFRFYFWFTNTCAVQFIHYSTSPALTWVQSPVQSRVQLLHRPIQSVLISSGLINDHNECPI